LHFTLLITPLKFLVLSPASVSEVVFLTPLLRALKIHAEEAEVHLVTKAVFQNIITDNPYLDRLYIVDQNFWQKSLLLRHERYNFVFDFECSFRSSVISLICNTKTIRFKKLKWQHWLMVNFKINALPNKHLTDRFLETIEFLKIKSDDLGLDYFIPDHDKVPTEWLPDTHRHNFVTVIISASYNTRKLPANRLIELCDKINKPIILLGMQADLQEAKLVEDFFKKQHEDWEAGLKELNKKTLIFNACGKFNFNQTASIIKRAQYVFTYDNDFVAVASAFKRNIFVVLGNTTLSFGRYPYKTKFTILENNKVNCRPCSSKGYRHCPKGHFNCMNKLTFDFYPGWRN
jgi:ADP-heptose:LPS heptosyltransferase